MPKTINDRMIFGQRIYEDAKIKSNASSDLCDFVKKNAEAYVITIGASASCYAIDAMHPFTGGVLSSPIGEFAPVKYNVNADGWKISALDANEKCIDSFFLELRVD